MNDRHRRVSKLKAQQRKKEIQKMRLEPETVTKAIKLITEALEEVKLSLGNLFVSIGESLKN